MSEETSAIIDRGAAHKYRTEIPNIVLDLGLRPFTLALYVHLKRTAGDGGVCEKSSRRLAAEMGGVSVAAVSRAKADLARPRDELDGEALIKIAPIDDGKGTRFARDVIVIADIWPANMDLYGRSTMERSRSTMEQGRSIVEHKEEPLRKEPLGKNRRKGGQRKRATTAGRASASAADKPPRAPDPYFDAFVAAFSLPADAGRHASLAGEFSRDCKRAGATIDEFRDFFRAYRAKWGQYEFTVHGVTRAFLAWRVRERGAPAALAAATATPADDEWGWDFAN